MKNVLVRGPLLSQSGYGEHARQLFQFCESQKDWKVLTQILPWGITPWTVNRDFEGGLYGRIMDVSVPTEGIFDVSFQVQLPHEWDPKLAKYNVGVTAGVETDRCSVEWATVHREKMNLMIVPSKHAKKSFLKAGTGHENTPIEVVPEAYYKELLEETKFDPLDHLSTDKNFLVVGTLTSDNPDADRKNLVNTIRWFLHAFRNKKDVGLIVKTSKGRDTTIDRQLVRTLMKQIKDTSNTKDYPKLYMLHGSMTREEMTDLYKSKKLCGFVSATRGEGFGLPLLEAAVSGLPIVAPDWSAHTEFLAGPSFLRVLCDIKPVDASRVDGKIFIKNALWANPREGNYKRKLKVALDKNEQLKKSASILADKLKNTHSLDAIFSHYQRVVSEHL